jgi:hypothetical protein
MPDRFGEFLRASLGAVARDAPACARAVAAALGPVTIELVVDGERTLLRPGLEVVVPVGPPAASPEVHVATTSGALLALLDGRDELTPAVVDNRVRVRAAPRDAERLFDAMRWFVEGCARSSSAPDLLAEYRRSRGEAPGANASRRRT